MRSGYAVFGLNKQGKGSKMAPKTPIKRALSPDPNGMFSGMVVFLVENGVQPRRLHVWKQKLVQMGATIEDRLSKKVTHVFAVSLPVLLQQLGRERVKGVNFLFKFLVSFWVILSDVNCLFQKVLLYQWLEDSLRSGERVSEDLYHIEVDKEKGTSPDKSFVRKSVNGSSNSDDGEVPPHKKIKSSPENVKSSKAGSGESAENKVYESPDSPRHSPSSSISLSPTRTSPSSISPNHDLSSLYNPPDLNKNITDIFGKLIGIYRALGDDRRSFSYYKAIPVIEKVPFKIESSEQVKGLPGIGKSLQDHIQEIVTTGKLSKLEHFETDEKVCTLNLFGEVWGIGPATALKLYEKGYRTLDDLKNEDSLTHAQKVGLKYFNDIKTRIPRNEVQEMEQLLQKVGEEILPGVVIVCGGSYRRGKASCGDMDIVITHPDGKRLSLSLVLPLDMLFSTCSHKGFLLKYVNRLKDMKFLREDLIFSTHSEEGTDSGVDTYFGLCTYPGRELRHRIDFKVYPRDIYAFGLIAWTGNDVLNRRLRLLAQSKGFRLDDTGLFPKTQSSGGKRGSEGSASLKFDAEKEVFDFLDFPWLEPHERNL
ncbi:hypothetical protein K2173_008290 [Erythroxylum novogranatense]|uniref:DNA polymerase n=1 Tax=Erythroxylum novogranatense TaxID=1862640 RepID=A0AAV8U3E8_9ROSI|nr:hypothetical protein K2173_008290 [Erythroxylum novogranatense]